MTRDVQGSEAGAGGEHSVRDSVRCGGKPCLPFPSLPCHSVLFTLLLRMVAVDLSIEVSFSLVVCMQCQQRLAASLTFIQTLPR